ncbi:hypothetical protein MUP59_04910 [Candidatus Bathyarchaeota archaeon]|nr:hypothetical protein [Candidatus Bathyarchaeota archaeon]
MTSMRKRENFVPILATLLFLIVCTGVSSAGSIHTAFICMSNLSRSATLGLTTFTVASVNIGDHETVAIENRRYELTSEIIADESAVIFIRNSTLVFSPPEGIETSILLRGNARLLIIDSSVLFNRAADYCNIEAYGQAQINITNSELTGKGLIIGRNDSAVFANHVRFRSNSPIDRPSGFAMFGNSSLETCNSSFDGAYIWENSKTSMDESEVDILRTGFDQSTHTSIDANNSRIRSIDTLGGETDFSVNNSYLEVADFQDDVSAWFENSTIDAIYGTGNVTGWLDNSHVRYVNLEQGARVLIAIYFPVFGLVGIPYQMTGFLLVTSVLAVIAGLVAISYAVYLRTNRQRKRVTV